MTSLPPLPPLPARRQPEQNSAPLSEAKPVSPLSKPTPFPSFKESNQAQPQDFPQPQSEVFSAPVAVPYTSPQNASQAPVASFPASNAPVFNQAEIPAPWANEQTINGDVMTRWFKGSAILMGILAAIWLITNSIRHGFGVNTLISVIIFAVVVYGIVLLIGIPLTKTRMKPLTFNLNEGWAQIGNFPRRAIAEISHAELQVANNSSALRIGFNDKERTLIFIQNPVMSITAEDKNKVALLLPYTSLPPQEGESKGKFTKKLYPSKDQLIALFTQTQ